MNQTQNAANLRLTLQCERFFHKIAERTMNLRTRHQSFGTEGWPQLQEMNVIVPTTDHQAVMNGCCLMKGEKQQNQGEHYELTSKRDFLYWGTVLSNWKRMEKIKQVRP